MRRILLLIQAPTAMGTVMAGLPSPQLLQTSRIQRSTCMWATPRLTHRFPQVGDLFNARFRSSSHVLPTVEHDTYMTVSRAQPNEGFNSSSFVRQASVNLSAFKKAVQHIESMFPRLPRATIEEVLKAAKAS